MTTEPFTPVRPDRVLEDLVDRYGLVTVLNMLGSVCFDKADHVKETYADTGMATVLNGAGAAIAQAAAAQRVKAADRLIRPS